MAQITGRGSTGLPSAGRLARAGQKHALVPREPAPGGELESVLGAIIDDQHWLAQLWEHTSDAMALSDEVGTVLAANPAYYRLYGYPADEVLGNSFAVIFSSEHRAAAQAQYREIFRSGVAPGIVHSTVTRRDGNERVVEARACFIEAREQRRALLSIIRDITEEVTAREATARAQRELRTFLFGLSHDIKNPLAVIKGHAQVLRRELAGECGLSCERFATSLAQIDANVGRVVALVDELVEVAAVQQGESVPLRAYHLDFVAVVRETVNRHQLLADRHQILLEVDNASLPGVWDGPRLTRVLDNLLGNAIKYSPDGGVIAVRVGTGCAPRGHSPGVLFSVEDHGIGIATNDLAHVFEPFHRGGNVPDAVIGSGIGLASVQQIVHQHGGTVDITSGIGSGTCVTLWLPFHQSAIQDPVSVSK